MQRLLWLPLLLLFGSATRTMAQIASFSFSSTTTLSGWTRVAGNPATGALTGTMNGITVSSIGPSNWSPDVEPSDVANNTGAANATYFPAVVMASAWYQWNGNTNNLALYNAAVPQLKLSGLNADSTYTLRMSSSCIYNRGVTQYTVAGKSVAGSQTLVTYNNTSQGVTFQRIQPDSNGNIWIYVSATTATSYAFISGLQVYAGSSNVGVPVVALTAPASGAIISEGSDFSIAATASETAGSITKVEFYADTAKIGEADAAPYTMTWTDPGPGGYVLTAKATDASGTISTVSINVGVDPLNYFWSTTGNVATGGDTNFVGTVDSNRLAFRTKNLERMTISAIGNIGVGTTAPTAQWHTTGTVRLAGLKSDSTNTLPRVLVSDTSGNLYYRNASGLSRWSYSGGTLYDSVDNIAIGTSNPDNYKLAVNGTAIFTKVKVKTAGTWPDYVFEKGYALPSLAEVERFISEHRHLPGIASEQEVQLPGIDLGDHAVALLKKVEELTLYLIEQNKTVDEQYRRLTEQEHQLAEQARQLAEQKARLDAQQKEIDELKALIKAKN